MENQRQNQLIEQIRPVIAAYAAAGQRFWHGPDVEPPVDIDRLLALPAVQCELARFDGDVEMDLQAGADAIDTAIKSAIASLPSQLSESALEYFGFRYRDPISTPYAKRDREERAALALGRKSQRWYDLPNKKYEGLKPRDYVTALVSCVLCGVRDPIAFLAGRESVLDDAPTPEDDPPAPLIRRLASRYQRLAVLGAVLAMCAAIIVATQLGGGHSNRRLGGAATVSISPPGRIARLDEPGISPDIDEGGAGLFLAVCTATRCRETSAQETQPKIPANLPLAESYLFRLEIRDTYSPQIASMNLKVSSAVVEEGSISVTAVARWPPPIPTNHIEVRASTVGVPAPTQTASGLPRLEYVAGSTELYERGASGVVPVLKLPDGLFSRPGLTLTHVGFARTCRLHKNGCPLITMAIIYFEMRPAS